VNGAAGVEAQTMRTEFSAADIEAFKPTMKLGILSTVTPEGMPHLTLISSLQASTPTQMIWGQFVEGSSKAHVRQTPKVGFLIMTLDKQLWRGKARFTHTANQGPHYEMFNNTPMFRYNSYFGIHTVYYMDLVAQSGRQRLTMGRVVAAAVATRLARALRGNQAQHAAMNGWTQALFNGLSNLKFLATIGADGYPVVIPVIQAQAADGEHLLFHLGAYGDELRDILEGTPVAVFGMTLDMEDVLVRGTYLGVRRPAGLACGCVRVDWIYNPMPPKAQQIYPPLPLTPITEF
jgi:hypothetical protein